MPSGKDILLLVFEIQYGCKIFCISSFVHISLFFDSYLKFIKFETPRNS